MRKTIDDVRFAVRVLSGAPGFALVATLTLALGIASVSTVWSWIDSVLLRPFHAASQPEQLAGFEAVTAGAPNGGVAISWPDYVDFREKLDSVSGIAVRRQAAFSVGEGEGAQLVWGEIVAPNFFEVLGVQPRLGRVFSAEEHADKPGAYPVVVISDRTWRRMFHQDPAIAGKILRVNHHDLTIIGVAPRGFHGSVAVLDLDLWIPASMGVQLGALSESQMVNRGDRTFDAFVRLKPGVAVEQARAEAATIAANLAAAYPKTNRVVAATVLPPDQVHNGVTDYLAGPLRLLLAASVVVLVIVCVNVANLLLARSVSRQREFGIRLALGAGKWRVARQVLTETSLLAGAGGLVSIPLMLWMSGSLISLVPSVGLPLAAAAPPDTRIFLVTLAVCLFAALASSTAPALFLLRAELNETLKDGGRTGTSGAAANRARASLVVAEVALATVALVGAGLFIRSYGKTRSIYPGFDASNVLFARFFIESAAMTPPQIQQFAVRLRQRVEALPGVAASSYSDFTPLASTAGPYSGIEVNGYTPAKGESMNVNRARISPGYFESMHIPLAAGRDFNSLDTPESLPVAIVNEAFARRYLPSGPVTGRTLKAMGRTFTIIGLSSDSKYFHPAEPSKPFFYVAFAQVPSALHELDFFVRTPRPLAQVIPAMRRTVTEVEPRAAAFHAVALDEYTQVSMVGQKIAAGLMGALGAICVGLAALGLYSVLSYAVSQRVEEIGIRMAMGASPQDVVHLVVRQGMTLALAGLLAGCVVALAAARLVAGMLIGIPPADPLTFAGTALFLLTVALAATGLPACRATRIEPMIALRRQ